MDTSAKVRAEDLLRARGLMDNEAGTDWRVSPVELRKRAARVAQDREIREATILVLVESIKLADTRGGDGTEMARRSAHRLGGPEKGGFDKSVEEIAAYLVDQGVNWNTVLTMNS
jgi:hypothetical protein